MPIVLLILRFLAVLPLFYSYIFQITFEIEDFNVEMPHSFTFKHWGCLYDKLTISDLNDGLMGELCGWDVNSQNSFEGRTTWTTSSSHAQVSFKSDSSVQGHGFRIKYTYDTGGE